MSKTVAVVKPQHLESFKQTFSDAMNEGLAVVNREGDDASLGVELG